MSTRCNIEFNDQRYESEISQVLVFKLAARLYKHSDGYPSNIIPMLRHLEDVLSKNLPLYGPRLDDAEWAAAEFVNQYRLKSNAPLGKKRNNYATQGNIYVCQERHGDIAYLYVVNCDPGGWSIQIFKPVYDRSAGYNISGYTEVTNLYNLKTGEEKNK